MVAGVTYPSSKMLPSLSKATEIGSGGFSEATNGFE
jgi:hypothetical protein